MRVELHPAARVELLRAVEWYITEADKIIAARFIAEFEQLESMIRDNPQVGAPGQTHSRRLIFRRFPYSLVYRIHGNVIQILALAHHSRRPDYWISRT